MRIGDTVFIFFKVPQIDRKNEVELTEYMLDSIFNDHGCSNNVITDSSKEALSLNQFKQLVNLNFVSQRGYLPKIFDCEDFTITMLATVTECAPNLAFGMVHVERHDLPMVGQFYQKHALNFFVTDQKQLYFFEPQTGQIFQNDNYKPYFFYC